MPYENNFAVLMQVADDPVFVREGADVYVDANISFTQVRTEILCKILVVLSIWLGAATLKCTCSTQHENILFLFVQITVSFLICWFIPPWSAWILHSNQSNKYHILVLWIWTQKNSILQLNIVCIFLQAILGGKVEVPTLSGKTQVNVITYYLQLNL